MSYLILADLHLDNNLPTLIKEYQCMTIKSIIAKSKAKYVVIAGDTFHVTYPSVDSYSFILNLILENKNKIFIFVIGNHDYHSEDKNALNIFEIISKFVPNIVVVKDYLVKDNITFISYPFPIENIKTRFVIIHSEVQGAKRENNSIEKRIKGYSLSKEFLMKNEKIMFFSGHYHNWQKVYPNFSYIGSPYQTTFGDKQTKKRCLLIKGNKYKWKVINPYYKFYSFYVESDDDVDWNLINDSLNNNFFSVTYNKNIDRTLLKRLTSYRNIIKLSPVGEEIKEGDIELKERRVDIPTANELFFVIIEKIFKENGFSKKEIELVIDEIKGKVIL